MAQLAVLILTLAVTLTSAIASDNTNEPDKGKIAFKTSCVACHGSDGAGTALGKSMKAADLRSPKVQKQSDAELAQVVSDGKGNMPSFKHALAPEQIQALVAHIRELGKKQSAPK